MTDPKPSGHGRGNVADAINWLTTVGAVMFALVAIPALNYVALSNSGSVATMAQSCGMAIGYFAILVLFKRLLRYNSLFRRQAKRLKEVVSG